jgi:hypothetical protein
VKLHKLKMHSKKVQRMINGLSELVLSRLHAAFCKYASCVRLYQLLNP